MSFSEWIILRTGGQTWYDHFYTTYICLDLAYDEIFRAKVGKSGIFSDIAYPWNTFACFV